MVFYFYNFFLESHQKVKKSLSASGHQSLTGLGLHSPLLPRRMNGVGG